MTVVTCPVPPVLPAIQRAQGSLGAADGHNNLMQGTPSFTGLKCQEISDEVPQLVGLKNQVRHGLVRRLKRHLQGHCGHARHVGDLCKGRRIRIPGAVLHSKDSVTRSACRRLRVRVSGRRSPVRRRQTFQAGGKGRLSAYRYRFRPFAKRCTYITTRQPTALTGDVALTGSGFCRT